MSRMKIALIISPLVVILTLAVAAPELFSSFKNSGDSNWSSAAERGAPQAVNTPDHFGITPLMRAALDGRIGDVRWLINKNANVNARDKDAETALMAAAFSGHTEVVELLLNNGANVNAISSGGETALSLAQNNGHDKVIRMLVANGAKGRAKIRGN